MGACADRVVTSTVVTDRVVPHRVAVTDEVVWVETEALRYGPSLRSRRLDPAHVATLAELDGRWPPILVRRRDRVVVDGHHRVAAARLTGRATVAAVWFQGTDDDAFVEAVRLNVEHGLPLTVEERKSAASFLLVDHPDWSDRRIAQVCALSPRTVGRLRSAASDEIRPAGRVGRDGRLRSVNPESARRQIIEAVSASPTASLRAIAREVGTSPETVRRIRQRVQSERVQSQRVQSQPVQRQSVDEAPTAEIVAIDDAAVASTCDGQRFVAWLNRTGLGDDWQRHVDTIPLSRVYEVADEARRRARAWTEFAEAVEGRARSRRAV
jgi:ParB-like chromosome segregation protein Spo0J